MEVDDVDDDNTIDYDDDNDSNSGAMSNICTFQEPSLTQDEPGNALDLCASDSQTENEFSLLEDETYADENWESDSYDQEEGEDDLDVLVAENGPGDVTQNDTQTSEDSGEEQPLYAGAPITLGTSILLTLTFAMSYSLSGEALSHLLELIDAHCITPNLCITSITKFKSYFKQLKTPICYHYYCPFCYGLLENGVNTQNCAYCGLSLQQDAKLKTSFFIEIPIEKQLVDLF